MIPESPDTSPNRDLTLVFIEDHPKAMVLLRTARARAQGIHGRWCAVFLETHAQLGFADDGSQERMLGLLTLAEQMGGETAHVEAETAEKGFTQLMESKKDQVALIIVGSIEFTGRLLRLRASQPERLAALARSRHLAVETVPLFGQYYKRSLREWTRWIRLRHIVYALVAVGFAHLCALLLEMALPPALFRINDQNVGLLFMIACAFTAGRFGLLPGLVASVASYTLVNYYFTAPYHMLKMNNITDILSMSLFLSASVLVSLFTSQTRGYAEQAAKRELSTQALFTLYRIASAASSRKQALETLQSKLMRMLKMDVAFFLPPVLSPDRIEPAYPTDLTLSDADRQAVELCWSEMKTTGVASPFNPGTEWRFEPMLAPGGEIGVLAIRPSGSSRLDAWFGRLLTAIADQTAAVIEHIELERSMEATRIREEREKLRSMLLSSVSHDLKTPLASIVGALSIYRGQGEKLSPEKRKLLIDTAIEESERLDSFITNILSMTRLESGKIEFRREWHSPDNMVPEAIKRLGIRTRQHPITIHPHDRRIEVSMDMVMTEQVLQNLLDNALKYTPPGTLIEIRLYEERDQGFFWEVRDHGGGLPPDKLDRIFDKYARLQRKDSQIAGTGLGLAICKAIMEAQGGSIAAANHPDGGAIFTVWLPKWRKADVAQYVA